MVNIKKETASGNAVNLQFKLLSAIGIVIIVAGHCHNGGFSLAYDWFPAYSFNISLMVFISGYFYKTSYESNILKYIWKRTKRLIIPAYIWNILYGFLVLLLSGFGYTIGAEFNLYNLFISPFVDGEAFQYNLGSWFVYPLFFVCVFNVLFRKLLGLIKLDNEYLLTAVYLAVGMLGIQLAVNNSAEPINGVMRLALRSMFFLPCFQLGRLYKTKLESRDRLNSLAYFAILFAVQLLLLTFCNDLRYSTSFMKGFDNGVIVPYVTSITGIAFWLRISKLITPVVRHWKFVRLIADNTYSIMIHQVIGYMTVKWIFCLISATTPLFSYFDAGKMKSDVWYYFFPHNIKLYAVLYLAGGIFVPVAIKLFCNFILKAGKKIRNNIGKEKTQN